MSENPHPLDRDDYDQPHESGFDYSSPQIGRSNPNAQMLTWCVRAIIALALATVAASVVTNNVQFDSPVYWLAYGSSRFLMFLLLLAFSGILVAYQWTNIQKWFNQFRISSSPRRGGIAVSNQPNKFVQLLILNFGLLVLVWAISILLMILGDGAPVAGVCVSATALFSLGIFVSMIVWHRGVMQAFAIGALTTHVSSLYLFSTTGIFYGLAARGVGIQYGLAFGTHWTVVFIGGLLSAAYVWFVFRSTQNSATHGSNASDLKALDAIE